MNVNHKSGASLLEAMKATAILILLGSFISSVFIWTSFGTIEIPSTRFSPASTETNWPMVFLAIGLFAQSVLAMFVAFTFSYLASTVAAIHQLIEGRSREVEEVNQGEP
jgi:hypothetical protein